MPPPADTSERMDENVPLDASVRAEIVAALWLDNEIAAIKAYRRATGAGLADAKSAVETIARVDGIVRTARPTPAVIGFAIVAFVVALVIIAIRNGVTFR